MIHFIFQTRPLCLAAAAALMSSGADAGTTPPYDATADTVFDIITQDDPTSFVCLADTGRGIRQMWDKRADDEFDHNAWLFEAHYADGKPIEVVVNPEFASAGEARPEALRHARILGQLPPLLRAGITRFGIHKGDKSFHAGAGKIFVYTGKSDLRVSQNHLEESLFHEAVHVSIDPAHRDSDAWRAAQQADGAFLTDYAAERPDGEDLAETALFAFGLIYHPERIPPVDARVMQDTVPARIGVLETILAQPPPDQQIPPPPADCR